MKISDKALRLIGRKILGRMDTTTGQDDTRSSTTPPAHRPPPHPRLNLQPAPKPVRAPVLPFPRRDDD